MKRVEWYTHNNKALDISYIDALPKDPDPNEQVMIDEDGGEWKKGTPEYDELKESLGYIEREDVVQHFGEVLYIGQEDQYDLAGPVRRVVFIIKEEETGLVWSLFTNQIRYI